MLVLALVFGITSVVVDTWKSVTKHSESKYPPLFSLCCLLDSWAIMPREHPLWSGIPTQSSSCNLPMLVFGFLSQPWSNVSVFSTILSTKSFQFCQFSADKTDGFVPYLSALGNSLLWCTWGWIFLYSSYRIFMRITGSGSSGQCNIISTILGFVLKEIIRNNLIFKL